MAERHPIFYSPFDQKRRLDHPNRILRGDQAERRTKYLLSQMTDLVQEVSPSSKRENFIGIDFWVEFIQRTGHKNRPLQVKSSPGLLKQFLESDRYAQLLFDYGAIILLEAGPKVSNQQIRKSFLSQLEQIDGFI